MVLAHMLRASNAKRPVYNNFHASKLGFAKSVSADVKFKQVGDEFHSMVADKDTVKTDIKGLLKATAVPQWKTENMRVQIGGDMDQFFCPSDDNVRKLRKFITEVEDDKDLSKEEKQRKIAVKRRRLVQLNVQSGIKAVFADFYDNPSASLSFEFKDTRSSSSISVPLSLYHVERFIETVDQYPNLAKIDFVKILRESLQHQVDLGMALFRLKGREWGIDDKKDVLDNCLLSAGRMEISNPLRASFLPFTFVFNKDVSSSDETRRVVVPLFVHAENLKGVHFNFISHSSEIVGLANLIRTVGRMKSESRILEALKPLTVKEMMGFQHLVNTTSTVTFKINGKEEGSVTVLGAVPQNGGNPAANDSIKFGHLISLWSLWGRTNCDDHIQFARQWKAYATKKRPTKESVGGGCGGGGGGEKRKSAPKGDGRAAKKSKQVADESAVLNETVRNKLLHQGIREANANEKASKKSERERKMADRHNICMKEFDNMVQKVLAAKDEEMKKNVPKAIVDGHVTKIRGEYEKEMQEKDRMFKAQIRSRLENGKKRAMLKAQAEWEYDQAMKAYKELGKKQRKITEEPVLRPVEETPENGFVKYPELPSNQTILDKHSMEFNAQMAKELAIVNGKDGDKRYRLVQAIWGKKMEDDRAEVQKKKQEAAARQAAKAAGVKPLKKSGGGAQSEKEPKSKDVEAPKSKSKEPEAPKSKSKEPEAPKSKKPRHEESHAAPAPQRMEIDLTLPPEQLFAMIQAAQRKAAGEACRAGAGAVAARNAAARAEDEDEDEDKGGKKDDDARTNINGFGGKDEDRGGLPENTEFGGDNTAEEQDLDGFEEQEQEDSSSDEDEDEDEGEGEDEDKDSDSDEDEEGASKAPLSGGGKGTLSGKELLPKPSPVSAESTAPSSSETAKKVYNVHPSVLRAEAARKAAAQALADAAAQALADAAAQALADAAAAAVKTLADAAAAKAQADAAAKAASGGAGAGGGSAIPPPPSSPSGGAGAGGGPAIPPPPPSPSVGAGGGAVRLPSPLRMPSLSGAGAGGDESDKGGWKEISLLDY